MPPLSTLQNGSIPELPIQPNEYSTITLTDRAKPYRGLTESTEFTNPKTTEQRFFL